MKQETHKNNSKPIFSRHLDLQDASFSCFCLKCDVLSNISSQL